MQTAFLILGVVIVILGVAIAVILFALALGRIIVWSRGAGHPRLTVDALVVAKRAHVTGDDSGTLYYVTFQMEDGARMELHVRGREYGLLVEGDRGKLTYQGRRYFGFERV